MVSNRLLQDCLEDFHNIMRLNVALYDRNCTCVAGEEEKAPELDIFHTFCDSAADMQALGTRYLFKVGAQEPTYILSVSGDSKDIYPMGQLAVKQLERILEMGYSREDRNQFIHNLLLDNLLPVDIVSYAKQMHIGPEFRWAVLLVEGTGCEAFDIQNILKNAALKSTKKRQLLLFLLQKQARPMTAEELHELAEHILPMNTSTVYRTLNTLTEKEILIRSVRQDGKAYYALAKKDHSHRLVCDLCGKVIPVDTCPLSELEETLQQKTGFRITGHSLEFTGLCPECSQKNPSDKE